MRGILCGTTAKNNEEYRLVVQNRMKLMAAMMFIGILTSGIALAAEEYLNTSINEHMIGVYTGVGAGLFVGGLILFIKHILLLNNEDKLKESRLMNSDERIQTIEGKAFRSATYVMITIIYIVGLIGGFYYPVLSTALAIIIVFFCAAYFISYQIYSRKM